MAEQPPEHKSDVRYEKSRVQAKRAQLGLNILVVLSALAGATFFFYVLTTINPWRNGDRPEVNVPTSTVAERLGVLEGEDIDAGLFVILRDIDEAPEYRTKLSDRMRDDLGIKKDGRLYLLIVRNHGENAVKVNASKLRVSDKDERNWEIKWLEQVANGEQATAVGRMRLGQSESEFELPPGSERQLYVFAPADSKEPPSAESFLRGELVLQSGVRIPLEHIDVKVAEQ